MRWANASSATLSACVGSRAEYCDEGLRDCRRSYLRNHSSDRHKFGRGSIRLLQCYDTLCTSGFMDDVIFAHNAQYGGVWIPLQRVTSLHRRVRANDPAASYWL